MTDVSIDQHLISMLRCPVTHSPVRAEGDKLVAEVGGLKYTIRDGIPVMLAEEAELPEGFSSLDDFKAKFGRHA